MTYLEFKFSIEPLEPAREIVIAELDELGFESFVEIEDGLLAYITPGDSSELTFEDAFVFKNPEFKITWSFKEIQQQNWNAEWESSFEPIEINPLCRVRAPFHAQKKVPYEIVIEPKMSFGTGHHETTHLMLQLLLEQELKGKSVLDMGCGTGVLAILSEMCGAELITAIDIDEWCVVNTTENLLKNDSLKIKVRLGDASLLHGDSYDVIIANINRNILLEDIPTYVSCLNENGILLLSGFYMNDLDKISAKCRANNLRFEKNLEKNNWVAAKYVL